MKSTNEEGLIRDACDLRYINQLSWFEDSLRLFVQGLEIQSATVIRRKPGKRCLIKYGGIDARGLQFQFVGKMRFKGLDRYSPAMQRELFMNGFDGVEGISVPQVYGELPSLNMWLQEFMHNASALSVESRKFIAAQKRVALALSRLHKSSITPAKLYTLDDELALLGIRFQQLKQNLPQLTKLVDSLQAKVSKIAEALRPSTHQTTIHRDFYFEQILISKSQVTLVDLDLCCTGPPELDVGNYIGHLREYAIRHPYTARRCRKAEQIFLQAYFDQMPSANRMAAELWASLTLARHVSLSTLIPGRSHTTRTIAKQL